MADSLIKNPNSSIMKTGNDNIIYNSYSILPDRNINIYLSIKDDTPSKNTTAIYNDFINSFCSEYLGDDKNKSNFVVIKTLDKIYINIIVNYKGNELGRINNFWGYCLEHKK